jgi:acetyl-CoA carboxylase biotin carboxylase subunit
VFQKILVANRGEIALRIIRACRELGIATVAVHFTADAGSRVVRLADEAVHIGPAPAGASYLNVPNIIGAALRTGADAIHPGYGFLSEDPYFAEICAEDGITFIGPPPEVMARVGDKAVARRLMKDAGLPLLPGTMEFVSTLERAYEVAAEIGYPLIIKAAAGGGGRGITVVHRPEDLRAAYQTTRAGAQAVFRNSAVYLERYLDDARHIEVQVLCDAHGGAVHLGERDCSVQRRHQKLIEEAPSPSVDATLRAEIGDAAVRGALAVGYRGAGTMEFLLDAAGRFWFMEMNARIQVEHPVTEMVTGVDLIQEQIRIAAGLPLAFQQRDLRLHGHSVECRINAENPRRDFAPTPGRLTRLVLPGGPWTRVDTHCADGEAVPPYYDSMIAKLIVWGTDRQAALARMDRALAEFEVDGPGVRTTIPFHQQVLAHPVFREGTHTTTFLQTWTPRTPDPPDRTAGAVHALLRPRINMPDSASSDRPTAVATTRAAKPRIAVVGTGVAGLSAAYHLREHAEITLFEREDRVGGHANTIEVTENGRTLGLDTAFVIFNRPGYPNLTAFFDELQVPTLRSEGGFTFFDLDTGLVYGTEEMSLSEEVVQARYDAEFVDLWREARRFHLEGRRDFLRKRTDISLGDYLDRGGYSQAFRHGYVIQLCTAVWSVPAELIWEMPATTVIAFFMAHDEGGLGGQRVEWQTVAGGSITYVRKALAAIDPKLRLAEPVTGIRQEDDEVVVSTAAGAERFDHAIVAVHGDEARDLLENPTPMQRQVLGGLRYNPASVILHSDPSVMPADRIRWANWNYGKCTVEGEVRAYVAYNIKQLQQLETERDYFVTLDYPRPIRDDLVIAELAYSHPVIDMDLRNLQRDIYQVNVGTRLKLCGSYFHSKRQYHDQIGSHEAAFSSGMEAAAQLLRELAAGTVGG